MWQSINLSWKTAVQNAGCVFTYFYGGIIFHYNLVAPLSSTVSPSLVRQRSKKSSETSCISKKIFSIAESLHEWIKNKKLQAYKLILLEELFRFLDSALSQLIQLDLCLKKADPLIHNFYDSLFFCTCLLLSRFVPSGLV